MLVENPADPIPLHPPHKPVPERANNPKHGLLEHDNNPGIRPLEQSAPCHQHQQVDSQPLRNECDRQIPQAFLHLPEFEEPPRHGEVDTGSEDYVGGRRGER